MYTLEAILTQEWMACVKSGLPGCAENGQQFSKVQSGGSEQRVLWGGLESLLAPQLCLLEPRGCTEDTLSPGIASSSPIVVHLVPWTSTYDVMRHKGQEGRRSHNDSHSPASSQPEKKQQARGACTATCQPGTGQPRPT